MKILLTAFHGTSSQMIVEKFHGFDTMILVNDKEKSEHQLYEKFNETYYEYVFSFGQRPNIKDKIHIETTAKRGEKFYNTEFDVDNFIDCCYRNDLTVKVSNNAGTSFCNYIYYSGIDYIKSHELNTKIVFVHVPFEKNISDMQLIIAKIFNVITTYTGD